jgi:hypothetical protein
MRRKWTAWQMKTGIYTCTKGSPFSAVKPSPCRQLRGFLLCVCGRKIQVHSDRKSPCECGREYCVTLSTGFHEATFLIKDLIVQEAESCLTR